MGEPLSMRYWCYECSQVVNPVMGLEIKCPSCDGGFVEEMGSTNDEDIDLGNDRALSLWARILLGMLGTGSSRRQRSGREDDDDDDDEEQEEEVETLQEATELERDLETVRRRRRRSSAAILHMLEGLTIPSGMENSETERRRDRERVVLINPFDQTIILQDGDSTLDLNQNQTSPSSLGNYLNGPGLELLLQHLMDTDPNRYGTPPTEKHAIEAMPNVIIKDNLQCSVCLDDFEIGTEAKEMPCKHKFHSGCILPWLELHSSCPVCRFQMPSTDGPKVDIDEPGNSSYTM